MESEEIKKMVAIIFSSLLLCVLILMFVWTVVFVRYGDHVKYDVDIVVSIQLGIGLGCFFLILAFVIYVGMVTYAEYVSDNKVKELVAELDRLKRNR